MATNSLMLLENQIVNLEHVTKAEFTPAYAGGEENDELPGELTKPRKAKLELTLTSVHLDAKEYDYSEFHVGAASESDVVTLLGELAESAWVWLKSRALGGYGEIDRANSFAWKGH